VWIYTWIVVAILLVVVIIKFGAASAAAPFTKIGALMHNAGAAAVGVFTSKSFIEAENQNLKNQLTQAQVAIDRDKLLTQENSDLKELLGRHSTNSSILAVVLSEPPMSLYDTVVVDVGSSDHVSVGDTAIALGLMPIGTVSAVHPHTSTVQLFSSSGQKIDVRIGNGAQTTAEAQGGGNFLVKLPKGSAVAEGDPISAPGIGAEIFGHVENIETNENDPFIFVRFCLPVNMNGLHFLQIDRIATS
jgi:cell shape-determining protein MreC